MKDVTETVDAVVIREDTFNGVSKQWQADLYFKDGTKWLSWCPNYRTRKGLIEYIRYVQPNLDIVYEWEIS